MQIHVVNRGETLWQIAQNYNVSMNQIIRANGLDNPNMLVVGQALVIPNPYQEYVVQPGDALWAIARRYGTTIQAIVEANQLQDANAITVGQVLTIPVQLYTIKPGDTLWKIANQYGTTVEAIVEANQIQNPGMLLVGQVITIPESPKPVMDVNAYTTITGEEGAQIVSSLGQYFTYLSPFSYGFTEDGSISTLNDEPLITAARRNNVAPLLVLTNFVGGKFGSDKAATLLRNPELQDTVITNVLKVMREKGYTGLNIDFEYVYPEDRENYNNFLRNVVARLHPEGYSVSTAIAPKIKEDQVGLLYEAHDYAAHGEIVDFVVIMTYEWGWAGGRPWAIAPINEVRRVLDYAVTKIPRNKIMMGAPLYGRDWKIPWVSGTFARTVSPKQAVQIAAKYGVSIQYDEKYQSPFFRYVNEAGQEREVWFEDARSMEVKYNTAIEYGLRGISYWVLGLPFPQNWPVLTENITVNKL
ncbi:LysM peptidoglycan-binding domain-containing protein [Aquibacillus sp. 3ASR75-11]|uniref:LysM peptidoglycan-binding domain-containing protein n=1 Tax=Terrihalobacillus insolitus TaxID=2950438 RepID=A0A9X3WMY0_9BACI|nr:LysM peptidoglycan-binding domain-containing protein [Terrihalobacillus insolitus]MDC3412310.1 LysM peptidoglycan-binding domain-containing protein [Terrihalobacillus insolitus]MDC3422997.1 LysM peptidoglycan-binding domain-containing protein [Terrihalobacillus insolitus]